MPVPFCYGHNAVPQEFTQEDFLGVRVDEDPMLCVCAPDRHGRPIHGVTDADLRYAPDSFLGQVVADIGSTRRRHCLAAEKRHRRGTGHASARRGRRREVVGEAGPLAVSLCQRIGWRC